MTAETIAPVADGTNVEGALVCDKALCKKERNRTDENRLGRLHYLRKPIFFKRRAFYTSNTCLNPYQYYFFSLLASL
jgi:hypothetical protein